MTDSAPRCARRRFVQAGIAGIATASLFPGLLVRLAQAQERVAEDDQLAQQLGYKHDVADVDPGEWPSYAEGNNCANCQLYQGQEGDEWGPCTIFGGNLVNANGWCSAWVAAG